MSSSQLHQCSLTNVRYCLQAHPHADHLDINHLKSRSPGFGVAGAPVLNFYASAQTMQRASNTFERDLSDYSLFDSVAEERLNIRIHLVEPFTPITFGDYRVIAFPANHAPTMGAMLYSVEFNGRTLFYGTDTAALFDETWQTFHQLDLQFDMVVLDHTYGLSKVGTGHMNAADFIEHMQRMRREGILKPETRVLATHIAHDANPPHPQLEEFAAKNGYEVAFDGQVVEI